MKILINTTTQLNLHIINIQHASQLFCSRFQLQKHFPGLKHAKTAIKKVLGKEYATNIQCSILNLQV